MHDVDVAIIGGGPIGLSAGLALDALGYRVAVFERRRADETVDDRRVLALAEGSRLILTRLGIWPHLEAVTPITRIHVSESGQDTPVTLTATESGVPALGYVTTFNALMAALTRHQEARGAAWLRFGTQATVTEKQEDHARLSLQGDAATTLTAALVIHAEGGSARPKDPGASAEPISEHSKDYDQSAIVAEVWSSRGADHDAFEHFTEGGPVALLPHGDHYALIWTVPSTQRESLLNLDDTTFHNRLEAELPAGTGPIVRSIRRSAFPLRMRMARTLVAGRTLLMGNAAQQLHPVAAQGFNVGLRDVWALRELLWNRPADPGAAELLATYNRRRVLDRRTSLWITDGLIGAFGSTHPLLRAGRGVALQALRSAGVLRSTFARRMMFGTQ